MKHCRSAGSVPFLCSCALAHIMPCSSLCVLLSLSLCQVLDAELGRFMQELVRTVWTDNARAVALALATDSDSKRQQGQQQQPQQQQQKPPSAADALANNFVPNEQILGLGALFFSAKSLLR